jgi:hypothetical protein
MMLRANTPNFIDSDLAIGEIFELMKKNSFALDLLTSGKHITRDTMPTKNTKKPSNS